MSDRPDEITLLHRAGGIIPKKDARYWDESGPGAPPVDAVFRARVVDAVTQPFECNSLLGELADEVESLRAEVAYLKSVADDLAYNTPAPRSEMPRW